MRAKKIKRKTHIRTLTCLCVALPLGRRNSSDPMASASAPTNELAKLLPTSANSLAVLPPAASTAEAVDLSAGAAIRGLLVLVPVLVLLLRRVQASSPAKKLNAVVTCIKLSLIHI